MELEKLKQLLGITDETQDMMLKFIISDIDEIIKNYCNLEDVPEGLLQTAYRMAIDLYRNENIGHEEGALGSVASISEGDTSTSFRQYADGNYKDTVLKKYTASLKRYRKVGFS